MNRYRITTLKELLLIVTFLALCAAAFSRGQAIDARLAVAVSLTSAFCVSVWGKSRFRSTYLVTFGLLVIVGWYDYHLPQGVVRSVFFWVRNAFFEHGYDSYRLAILYSILLVVVPYFFARLRVAMSQAKELGDTPHPF